MEAAREFSKGRECGDLFVWLLLSLLNIEKGFGVKHKRNRVGFCKILIVDLFVWFWGEMLLLLRGNLPCDLLSMASLCSRYTT